MKVMNTITAQQLVDIAYENGQPVEFDQLLLVIE